jgi:murein DD-endopeptidase MepM/ murein hydrolase activator NlpD
MSRLSSIFQNNRFQILSWAVTLMVVSGMLLGALAWKAANAGSNLLVPVPTAAPDSNPLLGALPALGDRQVVAGIERDIQMETNIGTDRPRYEPEAYQVVRGDSVFAIADTFQLKPETVYWANYEEFDGSPANIQPGQQLVIPPTDGVYYEWEAGDTLETVAVKFEVERDSIISWPGNQLDLTNPVIEPGTHVMIPGAVQNDQPLFIQVVTRESTGGSGCDGGYLSRGFFSWPTGARYLSGYDFGQNGHNGIDISAPEGTTVWAADNGVVTMAQGGWNYGYGNVVQIDHGNGFVTIYAHLSSISVSQCQSISAGAPIGASGNTGNSQGAHLHFEIRQAGSPINPWLLLQ